MGGAATMAKIGMLRAASNAPCAQTNISSGSVKRPRRKFQITATTVITSMVSRKIAVGSWKLSERNSMMCCELYGSFRYFAMCTCRWYVYGLMRLAARHANPYTYHLHVHM